jgi:hypothetical protein
MVLAATTFEVVLAVLIPLISAFIGAVSGALVARHIRRAQLNAEAAVRIESYVVEANDAITAVKGDDPFDVEPFNRALNLLGEARFHSKRIDSSELDGRLDGAQGVATDIIIYQDIAGLPHLKRAIQNVMDVVILYMTLPPLRPWRREPKAPPSFFPTRGEYNQLVKQTPGRKQIDYADLLGWEADKEKELEKKRGR